MKVLALILVFVGAVGAVGATTAPAPVASASQMTTTTATLDSFSRPPRMAAHIAPVAALAKPHLAAVKKAAPKAHKAAVKHVTHKVVRTHAATRVVRSSSSGGSCGASCQWAKTASVWAKYPAWVETFALCVSHHESWSPHMWTAENPSSTASGGFQWLDGSWATNMARAGFSGPRHAASNSPIVQASVTAWVITHHGQRNWNGSHCGYGT